MPVLKRAGAPDLNYVVDDYTDPWRNAPYLILQHGNGRSSRFWYSWVPYLSRFYRIVRPDARGLGGSAADFDLDRDLTLEALVDDLAAINEANAASYLPRIEAPVLGLYPTAGRITNAEQERTLAAGIRNLRVVHLPTTFHKVQLLFPAACAGHLLHFISRHDGVVCREG